jgi:hypothetical protein
MKKLVAIVTVCLFTAALFGTVAWTVAEQCYAPKNTIQVKCLTSLPINVVGDCGDVASEAECKGYLTGSVYVYEVKDVPSGSIEADSGATHEVQRPCWRFHGCTWNDQQEPAKCENLSNWSTWRQGYRIEDNPDVTCPEE